MYMLIIILADHSPGIVTENNIYIYKISFATYFLVALRVNYHPDSELVTVTYQTGPIH